MDMAQQLWDMLQIIKYILLLVKENLGKYKMQFLNDFLYYYWKKRFLNFSSIQFYIAPKLQQVPTIMQRKPRQSDALGDSQREKLPFNRKDPPPEPGSRKGSHLPQLTKETLWRVPEITDN